MVDNMQSSIADAIRQVAGLIAANGESSTSSRSEQILARTEHLNAILRRQLSSAGGPSQPEVQPHQNLQEETNQQPQQNLVPQQNKRKNDKRKQTVGRVSQLLGNLRAQEEGSLPKKKKNPVVQVKYERYRENVGRYVNVPQSKQGGSRFFPVADTTSLGELRDIAVTTFFDPQNGYDESKEENLMSLVCGTFRDRELDMNMLLFKYLEEKCLKLGKTCFILRSRKIDDDTDEDLPQPWATNSSSFEEMVSNFPAVPIPPEPIYETAVEEFNATVNSPIAIEVLTPEPADTSRTSTGRIICPTCHHSYLGDYCEICEQDEAYSVSLNQDAEEPTEVVAEEPEIVGEETDDHTRQDVELTREEIAVRRVSALQPKILYIRRQHVESDMIQGFASIQCNDKLIFKFKSSNGSVEKGAGDGVCREAYATFWNEVLLSRFAGAKCKVPAINNHLHREEWSMIGKILLKGFLDVGYLPIDIAPAVLVQIFSEEEPSDQVLLKSFDHFMSEVDKDLVEAIKSGDDVSEDQMDDFVSTFELSRLPTAANIEELLLMLAKKVLIRAPHFVINCWRSMKSSWAGEVSVDVEKVILNSRPTVSKILRLLCCEPAISATERTVYGWLRSFVKELGGKRIEKFLQWATGSNLLLGSVSKIRVVMVPTDVIGNGLAVRPIARTCGPVIELPDNYESGRQLSRELYSIIDADPSMQWDFDIV